MLPLFGRGCPLATALPILKTRTALSNRMFSEVILKYHLMSNNRYNTCEEEKTHEADNIYNTLYTLTHAF